MKLRVTYSIYKIENNTLSTDIKTDTVTLFPGCIIFDGCNTLLKHIRNKLEMDLRYNVKDILKVIVEE